ncbi:MAG: phosphatidate cytidylyltransferase [Kofleriaceae bacterium]|nr:phosphatidate cytidylyltransferase [Myxococcales bacterium]MCB9561445.1 phosphatidate cytidylyltransferase [Kofleriaceae bacterium]MCB9573500.1 phosphatidate cytidylyltransferase [Kofleriaceae bacterium]
MAIGNLASRFLVAVVAVPIILVTLYYRVPEATAALVWVATLLAMREFFGMTLDDRRDRLASLIIGGIAAGALYAMHPTSLRMFDGLRADHGAQLALLVVGPLVAVGLAIIPTGLYYLFGFRDMQTVAHRFAFTLAGTVYVGLGMMFLALCKRDFGSFGGDVIVMILLVAWIGDTFAYFAGRFLGKRKLYEAVSPKKTWAGAIGGLAGSLVAVIVLKLVRLDDHLSWLDVVLIAIPGGVLGQLGDLAESLIKRAVGVKDSGSLLPGHGGMLDRIDAVLFIAPYVYMYMWLKPVLAAMF